MIICFHLKRKKKKEKREEGKDRKKLEGSTGLSKIFLKHNKSNHQLSISNNLFTNKFQNCFMSPSHDL